MCEDRILAKRQWREWQWKEWCQCGRPQRRMQRRRAPAWWKAETKGEVLTVKLGKPVKSWSDPWATSAAHTFGPQIWSVARFGRNFARYAPSTSAENQYNEILVWVGIEHATSHFVENTHIPTALQCDSAFVIWRALFTELFYLPQKIHNIMATSSWQLILVVRQQHNMKNNFGIVKT